VKISWSRGIIAGTGLRRHDGTARIGRGQFTVIVMIMPVQLLEQALPHGEWMSQCTRNVPVVLNVKVWGNPVVKSVTHAPAEVSMLTVWPLRVASHVTVVPCAIVMALGLKVVPAARTVFGAATGVEVGATTGVAVGEAELVVHAGDERAMQAPSKIGNPIHRSLFTIPPRGCNGAGPCVRAARA